ncbi:MAG: tripartite tricarboxylate transporter permease [Candidatus Aenigmarchaeota archaeon]|nr:tripartite tricarboxylate transporter permease [Candidatus Aenigmarchaeota archaeon]
MILEILIFSLFGLTLGILLGLLPGMHINNVLPLILSLAYLFPDPYYLTVFIISTAVSQLFTSFIPSIFLGAPDTDHALSVLPGHRMLLEGRGYEALKLTVIGGVASVILSVIFVLVFGNLFSQIYALTRSYINIALIAIIVFMIVSENKIKLMLATGLIILLSGLLGIISLNSSLVPSQSVLFPIFAGLFAISTLIVSINDKAKIPKQKIDSEIREKKWNIAKSVVLSVIAGIIVGLLPAIGVSQAAAFMQYVGGLGEARTFLVTISGINTANEVVSLNSLYLINNPRSGASVAIEKVLSQINFNDMLLFIGVIIFTSLITAPIVLFLGRKIPDILAKVNHTMVSYSVILFLSAMIVLITGLYGALIAITSTSIGLLCAYLGVNRTNCMGVLLVPSILFFSGLNPVVFNVLGL